MKKIEIRFFSAVVLLVAALVASFVVDNRSDPTDEVGESGESQVSDVSATMPEVGAAAQSQSAWFCPGVPANDKTVSGEILVANSTETPINGKITFYSTDKKPVSALLVIQPFSQGVFDATGGRRDRFVSAVVELDNSFAAVEQRIVHPAGDSVALCANRPSDKWFFADGFTGADSIFEIVLTNPYPDATVVDISFVTAEGRRDPISLKGVVLEPESVYSLSMGDQGARNEAVLAVAIRATTGRFVAGKMQHFLGRGRLGFSSSLGAPATSRQWWFADGQKDIDVDEQLVVFNPTDNDKSVSVAFLTGAGDEVFREPLVLTIPAGRVTILATSSLPAITDGRYGIVVTSINDDFVAASSGEDREFVVVEHVLSRKVAKKTGTTVSFGVPSGSPSKTWTIAGGLATAGGQFIVANTTSVDAVLKVSSVGPAGVVALDGLENLGLGSSAVLAIKIPATAANLQLIIESDVEIVVQRELSRGHDLVGHSSVLALPYRSSNPAVETGE